jgi:YD repeat-containing protein
MGQPCAHGGTAQQGSLYPSVNAGAGNPIHIVTGNKYQRDTDLPALPGLLGLEIVRHYNSRDPRPSALGQGWNFSYEARLYIYKHRRQILQADGSRIDFECSTQNCHAADPARGVLRQHPTGGSWYWPNGRLLQFNQNGRLILIGQPPYRPLTITRDDRLGPTQHFILRVTDPQGRQLTFDYQVTPAGARLAAIDSPRGRFIYTHDMAGQPSRHRLLGVTRPDKMSRLYLYESALQAGHPLLPTGVLLRTRNGRRLRTHTWAYDAQARAVLSTHGGPDDTRDRVQLQYASVAGVDLSNAGVTRIHSVQGFTEIYWARRGPRYVVTHVRGDGCPGCPTAGLTASYDAAGRVIGLNRLQMERGADGLLKKLRTDTLGWPGLQLGFGTDGRLSWWTSAVTGREIRKRDESGHVTERRFANGDVWRYAYNARGKPVEMIGQSAGKSLRTTIAWRNEQAVLVKHPHEIDQRRHDSAGRLVERRIWRPSTPLRQTAFGYIERYIRDAAGHITQHELPEGGKLLYRWSLRGRLLAIAWEDAAGVRQTLLTAPADGGPGYLHGNGLRVRGLVEAGRLSALVVDDGTSKSGLPLMAQTLRYDTEGRVAEESIVVPRVSRRLDNSYAYGGQGQLIGVHTRHTSAEHRASHHTWYAWDAAGTLRARKPSGGAGMPYIGRDASGLPRSVGARRLFYGPDRRLAEVRQDRRIVARYLHNAYGEQILQRSAGMDVFNLYESGRLVAQARALPTGNVGVERRYVYAGWTPVALIKYAQPAPLHAHAPSRAPIAAEILAIHTDATAAPRLITDHHRRVRWYAELSATGELIYVQGNVEMPLRLAGQIADPSTGWHANYLRTYDPACRPLPRTRPSRPAARRSRLWLRRSAAAPTR